MRSSCPVPDLHLESTRIDLGRLQAGSQRRVEVGWRRVGSGPLRVHGLAADCGCVLPGELPKELVEGATGVLAIEVRPPRRPGPFESRVRIVAGGHQTVVRLHGFVEREIAFRSDRLDLGPRTAGRVVERSLEVRATRRVARTCPVPEVRLEGLAGSARVRAPDRAGAIGWTVDLTLRVPAIPGPFEGAVVLRTCKRPAVRVPVAGRSVPNEASR